MAGTYTDIVEVQAPDEAAAGDTVNVAVGIANRWSSAIHIYCVGVLDSEGRFIDWQDAWVNPGETHYFNGSFVMPGSDVTINAYSYFEGDDGYLHLDDSKTKAVKLAAAPPLPSITNFSIADYVKV